MIDETLFDAEEKMEKAVSVARDDLSSIRTGRANPGMFSRISVDYYGSATPITQLSSINVPEARLVVIKPYEQSQLKPIEDAIREWGPDRATYALGSNSRVRARRARALGWAPRHGSVLDWIAREMPTG